MSDEDVAMDELLETIFARFHYDFRGYSRGTLRRRLVRALTELGLRDVRTLARWIVEVPDGFTRLLPHLTVQVSDLFRDPEYFRLLRERIVPILSTYPSLRIWVAGCATGEEAYSLAILLDEEGLLDRTQIYATDIDGPSLTRAERGVFGLDRLADFEAGYREAGGRGELASTYTEAYGAFRFDARFRKRIVFSDHSLATDHVFAEVQLVSCRNVLIYFDDALRERTIGLFRDALCRRGFLGLGSKESLRGTASGDDFETFDRDTRWYRRST